MSEYEQLTEHLEQARKGVQTLNTGLLDSFRLVHIKHLTSEQSQSLVIQLYQLLPYLQEDPTPICQFLEDLLEPWPLHAVLQIEPPVDFAAGLDVRAGPFNALTLFLLEKGVTDIASARRLATTQPSIFTALLKLWLCSEDAGVAAKAGSIIHGLLKADRDLEGSGLLPQPHEDPAGLTADNPVWRRVFRDPDVYAVLYTTTDLGHRDQTGLSKGQVTIAQARLMEFLPKLAAMDWNAAVKSHVASVEMAHGVPPSQGLVYYSAIRMVDIKGDVLLHRSLINFFADLLDSYSDSYPGGSSVSPPLAFLLDHKLHERTMALYVEPDHPSHDPLDITFLYAAAAHYVSTYATSCYWHFVESATKDAVLARLDKVLNIPPSHWHSSPPSAADLHVVASVPRTLLLSQSSGTPSPFLAIPTRPGNADGLNTLATILHGPALEVTFPPRDALKQDKVEMNAARQLYLDYLAHNPRMWNDITSTADTVAMKDTALAAINVVSAVASANWSDPGLPPEADGDTTMTEGNSSQPSNKAGIEYILTSPALTTVLPWILRPPQQFSGLVGGRGDAEGAAFRVATAKYDCLQVVEKRLRSWMTDDGPEVQDRRGELERIARALKGRVGEGVWGLSGDVGGRIATLEL